MKKSKIVVAIISLLSICSFVIGTSVAWLTSKTEDLVNTFTYGDINIKLDETDTNDGDENINTNEYKMLPGNEITKDPKVTVIANSEDSYLFVKLTKSENFDNFMAFEIAEGWTLLEETTGDEKTGVAIVLKSLATTAAHDFECFAILYAKIISSNSC
jgi:hypothetical protein